MKNLLQALMAFLVMTQGAQAQTSLTPTAIPTVTHLMEQTQDAVDAMIEQMKSSHKPTTITSSDYELKFKTVSEHMEKLLKSYEDNIRELIVKPLTPMIVEYNLVLNSKDINQDKKEERLNTLKRSIRSLQSFFQEIRDQEILKLFDLTPEWRLLSIQKRVKRSHFEGLDYEFKNGKLYFMEFPRTTCSSDWANLPWSPDEKRSGLFPKLILDDLKKSCDTQFCIIALRSFYLQYFESIRLRLNQTLRVWIDWDYEKKYNEYPRIWESSSASERIDFGPADLDQKHILDSLIEKSLRAIEFDDEFKKLPYLK